ncbi:MAG: pyruvate kinase [Pseudomonadota bacterium]|jgi:pyruvate kinase
MGAGLDLTRVALKHRRTRIVATVGPASSSPAVLGELVAAGVDVFRLNFSHGSHETHAAAYRAIRAASDAVERPVAVLADLCGPKIRVGRFEHGSVELEEDAAVVITTRPTWGGVREDGTIVIPSEYEPLARDLRARDRVLLADGALQLEVVESDGEHDIRCRVVYGGTLGDRKGMNLPGVPLSTPSLTEKDRDDAAFAASLGVDFMALSFVRSAEDIEELRAVLREYDAPPAIVAKIEKPEALHDIDRILQATDAVMVARGDLGVELPAEEVPIIQQELVAAAVLANRPVIVATQMLESMIDSPRPTRAEVSDVAWAAASGADAVMLSAETAAGRYPALAVQTMDRVLRLVEGWQWRHGQFRSLERLRQDGRNPVDRALSRATAGLSRDLRVRAIVVPTSTGRTAKAVSAQRPAAPIVPLCVNRTVWRQLSLYWGTSPRMADAEALQRPPEVALGIVDELGIAPPGSHFLLVWDTAWGRDSWAPTVSVMEVPPDPATPLDDDDIL